MKLVEINWRPTDRQLRQFGGISLLMLPLLGWLWGGAAGTISVLALVGLALAVVGWFVPQALRPVFVGLMLVTMPLGLIVSELAMAGIYFGVFLPIALVFRLMRRDSLKLKFDREATTYWEPKRQPASVASYYRQS